MDICQHQSTSQFTSDAHPVTPFPLAAMEEEQRKLIVDEPMQADCSWQLAVGATQKTRWAYNNKYAKSFKGWARWENTINN